jgi:hypothetical protein
MSSWPWWRGDLQAQVPMTAGTTTTTIQNMESDSVSLRLEHATLIYGSQDYGLCFTPTTNPQQEQDQQVLQGSANSSKMSWHLNKSPMLGTSLSEPIYLNLNQQRDFVQTNNRGTALAKLTNSCSRNKSTWPRKCGNIAPQGLAADAVARTLILLVL